MTTKQNNILSQALNLLEILGFLLFVILVFGMPLMVYVVSFSFNEDTIFVVEIDSDTSWSGSLSDDALGWNIEGFGTKKQIIIGPAGRAEIQKQTSDGTLTVTIKKGSTVLDQQATTASYGKVSVFAENWIN